MKIVNYSSKTNFLILAFSSGRLKIINLKSTKVMFNMRCVNDENGGITALDSEMSSNNETLNIFAGSSKGHIVHIVLNSKDTRLVKAKQIGMSKIK